MSKEALALTLIVGSLLLGNNQATASNESEKVMKFPGYTFEPPNDLNYQLNDPTIEHYYLQTNSLRSVPIYHYIVKPSNNPVPFTKNIKASGFLDREMSNSSVLSYLFYDDGSLVYDALPPTNRFDTTFNEESYFPSHSMGKSLTSYLIGHAICQGYIESVNAPITDWPLMEDTLYFGQPLINLLNMQAGDSHIIKPGDGVFIKTGRNIHGNAPLKKATENSEELKGTVRAQGSRFSYSNLAADVLFNYMMHRVGEDFDKFIADFYQNKVGVEFPVYLEMNPTLDSYDTYSRVVPTTVERINQGAGRYGIQATRYDYLRIAKTIMEDWQQDTCEGKYLKEIYKKRVSTHKRHGEWNGVGRRWGKPGFEMMAAKYAGQFWTDIKGLRGKKVLALSGAFGQQIAINLDDSRIVVIAAQQEMYYDTRRLGYEALKYGRVR